LSPRSPEPMILSVAQLAEMELPRRSALQPTMNQPSSTDHAADSPTTKSPLFEKVQAVIERIRPAVQSDGGDVELVEVTDQGVAKIRFHGACIGCPSSGMTLHMGIERNVREIVPGVTAVEQVD